jgi:hypothetical protein
MQSKKKFYLAKRRNTMKRISILVILSFTFFISFSFALAASYNLEVYQAQKALKELGYYPGKVDGIWGRATQRAIERYQRAVGLSETGRLDDQTKKRLGIEPLAGTRGIKVVSKQGKSLYLYKDYYALIVGVSKYEKWPRLPNATNDAKEVASKLKELGFEVKLVLDPTSREMKTVLNEMVYKVGPEENRALLFYYAGHGETETLADQTKMGYIVPRDCPLLGKDPLGFATHAISMRDIESASMRIRSKHVLMLFDSCFSGSLFALVRAVPDDITEKSTLPVRQYITAGREDEQVPDKSMFKRCFLIGLDGDADLTGDGFITGSELGMYLSDKVVNYTHRRQHPQYGKINNPDLDRGDFIFALKIPSKPSPPAPKAPPPSLDAEKKRLAEEEARLIRERQELERLKIEIERKKLEAERKKLEAEKKKIEMAKLPPEKPEKKYSPPLKKPDEVGRDGNFIAYSNGIVRDTGTGLEWISGPDRNMNWNKAKSWVESLNIAGGGWRMPTIEEIETLYKKGTGTRNITQLLKTTGWWVWSGETKGSSSAWHFYFNGGDKAWSPRTTSGNLRAFAVRSQKKTK